MKHVCLTNNPLVLEEAEATFVDGTPYDVLVAARDLVHKGWALSVNPQYGNFRPRRQPYRTLVLREPVEGGLDLVSLNLIDGAFEAWRADGETGEKFVESELGDYALVDLSLIRESFCELKK